MPPEFYLPMPKKIIMWRAYGGQMVKGHRKGAERRLCRPTAPETPPQIKPLGKVNFSKTGLDKASLIPYTVNNK